MNNKQLKKQILGLCKDYPNAFSPSEILDILKYEEGAGSKKLPRFTNAGKIAHFCRELVTERKLNRFMTKNGAMFYHDDNVYALGTVLDHGKVVSAHPNYDAMPYDKFIEIGVMAYDKKI